jgi:hypothetical protein
MSLGDLSPSTTVAARRLHSTVRLVCIEILVVLGIDKNHYGYCDLLWPGAEINCRPSRYECQIVDGCTELRRLENAVNSFFQSIDDKHKRKNAPRACRKHHSKASSKYPQASMQVLAMKGFDGQRVQPARSAERVLARGSRSLGSLVQDQQRVGAQCVWTRRRASERRYRVVGGCPNSEAPGKCRGALDKGYGADLSSTEKMAVLHKQANRITLGEFCDDLKGISGGTQRSRMIKSIRRDA